MFYSLVKRLDVSCYCNNVLNNDDDVVVYEDADSSNGSSNSSNCSNISGNRRTGVSIVVETMFFIFLFICQSYSGGIFSGLFEKLTQ